MGIANPPHRISQGQAARFICSALEMEEQDRRKLNALYKASGISQRYSVLDDYNKEPGFYSFFPNSRRLEPFPTVGQRMQLYRQHAPNLAVEAVKDCMKMREEQLQEVTHLITVSCTGMYAPGIDIELIEKLGLSRNIQRLAINFMGCYAAFNALKAGDAICKSDRDAKVLIVCVELCSIHFQKHTSLDHLISNAIFGDGAAAVLLEPQAAGKTSLSLEAFYCDIAMEGRNDMAWQIADFGFEMTLSSYVPSLIKEGIKRLTENLFRKIDASIEDTNLYAIHPGGRKILEAIEEALGISKHDNRYAYEVLNNYGNMSSPTVLFVLHKIFHEAANPPENSNIVSFAFGPGLTLEAMALKIHSASQEKRILENVSEYAH